MYWIQTSFSYIQNFNYQSGNISPQSCISPVPTRHPFVIYCHIVPTRITKFGQLILRKIIKIVATRCQILRPKCTKFDIGWGCGPHPAGGAYSAPPDPLAGFKGPTSKGREGRGRKRRQEGEEGSGKRKGEGGKGEGGEGKGDRDGRESLVDQGERKGKG